MYKKIEFSSLYSENLLHPVPAKKEVPNWYKEMGNSYSNQKLKNFQNPTVKKCVPFLDTLTSGYLILNPIEIIFWEEGEEMQWRYPQPINYDRYPGISLGIETHIKGQVSKAMIRQGEYNIPFKYMNPWRIKTPKNYSCLFVNPFHREESKIRILEGIVDTDTYHNAPVNFPFFLNKLEKDKPYIIKRGDPIALVFPFLRDKWKMSVTKSNDIEDGKKSLTTFSLIQDNYKSFFWKRKSYD